MLKFLNPQNVLEHLIELLLAENELRGSTRCHPGLLLPGILLPTVNSIKLCHPGAQDCLLAEAIDFWQAAHSLLNVLLEDLPGVVCRAPSALHHPGNAVAFQEHLQRGAWSQMVPGENKSPLRTQKVVSVLGSCLLTARTFSSSSLNHHTLPEVSAVLWEA